MKLVSKVFLIVMAVAVIACGGGGGSSSGGSTGGGTANRFAGRWSGTFSLERFSNGVKLGSTETGNAQLTVGNSGLVTYNIQRKLVPDDLEGVIQANDQMKSGAYYLYYLSTSPTGDISNFVYDHTSSIYRLSGGKLLATFSGVGQSSPPVSTITVNFTLDPQP